MKKTKLVINIPEYLMEFVCPCCKKRFLLTVVYKGIPRK